MRRVADCDQLVSDHQPTISLRRTPIHNLSHIDAIVTRYMLVAYSASNTEPEALCALQQLDLQQPDIARTAASSDIQSNFIAGPLERVHSSSMRHVYHSNIINLQNCVVHA